MEQKLHNKIQRLIYYLAEFELNVFCISVVYEQNRT